LIEKILGHRAQIKKCKEYFARRRASASGGGAVSSAQSRFGFCHIIPPRLNFRLFDRPVPRRNAPRQRETLARRAQRGSPSAGSKSLAILSIYFAHL
ncbi:MAG TPA: hypothetical protein VNM40_00220, partial [Candidatus Paceibacterota bacterium]|nr:hypothetical protein [Candidatus Paceibacterota bacterium]